MAKKKTTKKKVTKKTAPIKKKTAKKKKKAPVQAGAKRPSWSVNAASTKKQTERKSLFFKIPPGTTTLRILPPFDGTDSLFTHSALHYMVDTEDGQGKIAPACLKEHGDGYCYMCDFLEWMKASGEPILEQIGDDLYPTTNLHVQAYIFDKSSKSWFGPKLVRLSKGVADSLSDMLSAAEDNDIPFFCDPEHGHGIAVTKTGEKKATRYTCSAVPKFENLDDIVPGWEANVIKDIWKRLDVKVLDVNEQKKALHRTHPDAPWEDIQSDIG